MLCTLASVDQTAVLWPGRLALQPLLVGSIVCMRFFARRLVLTAILGVVGGVACKGGFNYSKKPSRGCRSGIKPHMIAECQDSFFLRASQPLPNVHVEIPGLVSP